MKRIENYTFFYKDKIAQWNLTPFYENGIFYNCAEQYMMYKKALLFNDLQKAIEILAEKDPREQQNLGREVRNYNQKMWDLNKEDIVYKGNLLKFSQNENLKKILLSTEDTILVEASKIDKIWGVGLSVDNPLILNEDNWLGLNLLGITLMRVRDILK